MGVLSGFVAWLHPHIEQAYALVLEKHRAPLRSDDDVSPQRVAPHPLSASALVVLPGVVAAPI